ncbi:MULTISPECIES: AglZ/HisF2 family acetamidino modification protein [Olivibacter]|uniref:imidazole glycerol-phosphate synthase n=1 Tax=Olivibacter jilunii TaxID=985016 RepID=A0ABW6B762_9SPHI|nr:AglZ/HisF2 family acetamidino modification protein [Olivibacter sp. UJ_SKK_5.1]MDX3912655.1 AglZ/HisF2 family acetamidino modification protein [Pseudosphingobacterium sp.]
MLQTRLIPCLQLIDDALVKTVKFGKHGYIGDPINTVRIFNELEVDELCFLDIRATLEKRTPNFKILHEIADECFMPLSYGGGVKDLITAKTILSIGFEKIVINSAAHDNPTLITEIANHFGSQSVVASIDTKKNFWGKQMVYSHDGSKKTGKDPVIWAKELESRGAGELLLTSIDQEGTWSGYDLDTIRKVTEAVRIPVIANGGAGKIDHIVDAVKVAGASAVALGSMVVYQQKGLGVLVNFPDRSVLSKRLLQD